MLNRLFIGLALFSLSLLSVGCNSSGKVNYKVAPGDWDEVTYGYLNVQTLPEGAIVSLRITGTFDAIVKRPFKDEIKMADTETNDWTAVGSTPVLQYKLALSCQDVQRKDGATIRVWYKADKVSVRLEKPGYETVTLESVGLNANKDNPTRLVVELEPTESQAD